MRPAAAGQQLGKLARLQLGRERSWCSESQLQGRGDHPPFAGRSLGSLFTRSGGQDTKDEAAKAKEKDKDKVATMGCIKEVNESDVSENNSPSPSPRIVEAGRARGRDQRCGYITFSITLHKYSLNNHKYMHITIPLLSGVQLFINVYHS